MKTLYQLWTKRVIVRELLAIGHRKYMPVSFKLLWTYIDLDNIGFAWSTPIDVFALGCTIFELYVGSPLFPHVICLREVLAFLERTVGNIDPGFGFALRSQQPDLFKNAVDYRVEYPSQLDGGSVNFEIGGAQHIIVCYQHPYRSCYFLLTSVFISIVLTESDSASRFV